MSSQVIPTIDFGAFIHGSADEQRQVALEVDAALSSIGFLRLRNHGIEQSKIESCFQWSKQLFALPDPEKQALVRASPRSHGFLRTGGEIIRDHPTSKESFSCGNRADDVRPNNWPAEDLLPGFRSVLEDFFHDCGNLVHQLLDCLCVALNLSADEYLPKYHSRRLYDLSLIHYPALSTDQSSSNGKVIRLPAHSDIGTLTLLFQDDVGGLELADMRSTDSTSSAAVEKGGKFVHVDPEPDTLLVNVGYILMKWSNRRWRNTVHRVSEPASTEEHATSSARDIPERFSIGYFCTPNPETVVNPFRCCRNGDEPPKKPLDVGKWICSKEAVMYSDN